MVQLEERAKHQGDPRSMEEQELLEQRRGAAVLLEHERQQQMAKIHAGLPGPEMGARPPMMSAMPPDNPMRGMDPDGMSMVFMHDVFTADCAFLDGPKCFYLGTNPDVINN